MSTPVSEVPATQPVSTITKKPASASKAKRTSWLSILTLHTLSINSVAILAIALVSLLHLAALSLFTKGFLLSRTTLEARNNCSIADEDCTLPAKYDRAVIVLIDALRYDFLLPVPPSASNYDPAHHNHLTLPAELAKSSPAHSLLFKGVADPPTTTLQRLKAITTGSLPTFIDAGSNFAGSAVEEDNWLEQANRAGKRIAFAGDDTWLTIFPESIFAPNLSFPFDSFNVEDLDTVDAGVREHVIPLLDLPPQASSWDILLAHPLGLDHAGHRFGASHSETTRKLKEMDILLRDIVARLGEKDLLVVLGDHGMDAKGDHGGDSPDETDAGLWMYSKTPLVPSDYLTTSPFPSDKASLRRLLDQEDDFFSIGEDTYRSVNQISLIPSLSLLLGFPIPLNNLGTIIPELFLETAASSWLSRSGKRGSMLLHALKINAAQIYRYVQEYTYQGAGADLAPSVPELYELFSSIEAKPSYKEQFEAYRLFTRTTLDKTRAIWARFDPLSMAAGIITLVASLAVIARLYLLSRYEGILWRTGAVRVAVSKGCIGALAGMALGVFGAGAQVVFRMVFLPSTRLVVFTTAMSSALGVALHTSPTPDSAPRSGTSRLEKWISAAIVVIHIASFASNSFTMWEDLIMLYLVQIPILFLLGSALVAPVGRLRWRIAVFSALVLLINRMAGISTICREEQHPYCSATFYGTSGTSVASQSAIVVAVVAALGLPYVVERFLAITKSDQDWAPSFLRYTLRAVLTGGAAYWMADRLEHTNAGQHIAALQSGKTLGARLLLGGSVLLGTLAWYPAGLCIKVIEQAFTDQSGEKSTKVSVIGWANAIGSSYLLLFLIVLGPIFLLAQPVGQIMYCLATVALLAYLEAADSVKDADLLRQVERLKAEPGEDNAKAIQRLQYRPTSFLSIVWVALFGFHLFFATGHQAVLSAIQWKVAFVGFPTVTYPFSPFLIVLNTLGPFILSAAAIPLLVFWNVSPSISKGPTIPVLTNLVNASLGFMLYHTAITLSSAVFSAHLRRHLMVWKVFAPRFMLSAISLLAIDATLLIISVGWGGIGTLRKLQRSVGTAWS